MIIKVENEKAVIDKLASYVERISNESIESRGKFFIGLSGGSLIAYLTEGLPDIKTDWSKWTLAFCDERLVPEDSEDSTYGTYKKGLIPKTELTETQFITIKQNVTAQEAADDYTSKLEKAFNSKNFQFDLLLLGLGLDGHTCSLFPDHQLLNENAVPVASITDSPKPPLERITLTYRVINSARNCIFAISGDGKADILKRVLKENENLPAGRVKPDGALYWIIDNAAASEMLGN